MRGEHRPIVVVGSLNMDLVSRVHAIPRTGQTVSGIDFQTYPGGKGANQAVGVARLNYPVKMIGMLGSDAFGRQLKEKLGRHGVDTRGILEVEAQTGTASIMVDDAGQNCIVVTSGANATLTTTVLRHHREVLRCAGMVLAQLEIPVETVSALTDMCQEMHVPLILDPAPAVELPTSVLRGATWFTPNEKEAEFYAAGTDTQDELVKRLLGMQLQGLILKRGAEGCLLVGKDEVSHRIAAPSVRAIDTTAAGDAFNAAFAVASMQGHGALDSAKFACTSAAISVTRTGAQPSLATAEEVRRAMDRRQVEEQSFGVKC